MPTDATFESFEKELNRLVASFGNRLAERPCCKTPSPPRISKLINWSMSFTDYPPKKSNSWRATHETIPAPAP